MSLRLVVPWMSLLLGEGVQGEMKVYCDCKKVLALYVGASKACKSLQLGYSFESLQVPK